MRSSLAVTVTVIALVAPVAAFCQGQSNAPAAVRILGDRTLWGDDFYGLLAFLPDFQRAGEQRVAVFPDRAVGERRFETLAQAQRAARSLDADLKAGADEPLTATVDRVYRVRRPLALQATAIQFLDDGSYRLAVSGPGVAFLAPGLLTATVLERLGPAERVTTELFDDGTERRPVILTVYHYAGGAIRFAESDVAPRPGFINRVFLDVAAVAAALRGAP
jgi:hypothetical protein